MRSASVAGPPGSVVRSPKNSTSTPPPLDVAVAQQADDLVGPQRLEHRRPASGPSGTTFMPSDSRNVDEPLEQLGRLERLDHDGDRWPLIGEPAAGPLPAAEVGQGEDHALARRRARRRCARSPSTAKPPSTSAADSAGQPEALDPVAGVGVERGLDRARAARRPAATGRRAAGGARSSRAARACLGRSRRRASTPRAPATTARAGLRGERARRLVGGQADAVDATRPGRAQHGEGAGAAAQDWRRRRTSLQPDRCGPTRRDCAPRPRAARRSMHDRARRSAWRHTLTKRWTAVTTVRTSITHRIGTQQRVEQQAEAQQDDPLGPLHQAALGVEAERLGLGPLVGDQRRQRQDGERQDRHVGRSSSTPGTRRRRRTAARR